MFGSGVWRSLGADPPWRDVARRATELGLTGAT